MPIRFISVEVDCLPCSASAVFCPDEALVLLDELDELPDPAVIRPSWNMKVPTRTKAMTRIVAISPLLLSVVLCDIASLYSLL